MRQCCTTCGRKVQWAVLLINLGMFVLKLVFGIVSQSKALYTDAYQSLANLVITIVIMASLKMASRRADEKYPYGYGKIEFLASGVVNTLLMIGAIIFTIASFRELIIYEPDSPPKLVAIWAAVVSVVANQIAFGYGRCAGEKLGSTAILANAMVNRADVGTSVGVIIAVIGSNMGFARLDHIMSILIGGLIVKVTWDGTKQAVKGLMDVSVHMEEEYIQNLARSIEGVSRVGTVKARLAGRRLWVDMNIYVPPDCGLTRGLEIVQRIKDDLHQKMGNVSEVAVQLLPLVVADDQAEQGKSNPAWVQSE